jgi:hypothetical protein
MFAPRVAPAFTPAAQEAEFVRRTGMGSADHANRSTEWLRETFERNSVADLNGDPPSDITNVRGLSPARARWARFFEWQRQVSRELHEFESRRADVEAKLAKAEADIKSGVRQTANRMLSGNDGGDDTGVLAARHTAEAARVALPELEETIDRAKLRVKHLEKRQDEFLHPVIMELAEAGKLGVRYMAAIKELRHVTELIFGLTKALGRSPQLQSHITLPRAILTNGEHRDYIIGADIRDSVWTELIRSLQCDPRADISVPE